jgi:hypothetical protein
MPHTMFELIGRTRWDQAYDFLVSGEPSMMLRILMINTIFVILYMIRRARSSYPMKSQTVMQVQGLLIVANALILFQREIMQFLDQLI